MKKVLVVSIIVIIYSVVLTAFIQLIGFSEDGWLIISLSLLFLVMGIVIIFYPKIVTNKFGKFGRWLIKKSVVSDIYVVVSKNAYKTYSIVFITLSISILIVTIILYFI